MRKEEIYLDLWKLSEAELEEVFALLPEATYNSQYDVTQNHYKLNFHNGKWWVLNDEGGSGKSEITFEQFKQLFAVTDCDFKNTKSNFRNGKNEIMSSTNKQLQEKIKKLEWQLQYVYKIPELIQELDYLLTARIVELSEVKGGQVECHAFIYYRSIIWKIRDQYKIVKDAD